MRVGHISFGHQRDSSRVWQWLLSLGVAGMAASIVALAPISEGTPARSSDPESPAARLIESVFETTYSDIGEYRAPISLQTPRVRLASLDMDFTVDPASAGNEGQTTESIAAMDRASFRERFNSSYGERLSSFDERFGTTTEGDREPTPPSVQRGPRLPLAELDRDSPGRLEAPKRQNARLAVLAPAANAPPVTQALVGAAPDKPMRPADPRSKSILPDHSRTAIYDISARVVYLPNGDRLEAHSGVGEHMDDPRSVSLKMHGVTPPNVYTLSMRERLFHGVRAVRLNPVDPDKMFGRAGMLAHSYLLGPNGDSNGCVSIKDYNKFLNAFLNGEIERLVVVDSLSAPPSSNTAVGWLSERVKALFRPS